MIPLKRRPFVIANTIRLKRSQHSGPFLVVEGRDDRLLCERYTSQDCGTVVAGSKSDVYDVICILDDSGFPGVLGVVDPDFDALQAVDPPSQNIVTWGSHDLEVTLFRSPALDRVLGEYGSSQKIKSLGMDARDLILSAAAPVGYLRWASLKYGLNLRFQGLNLARYVDKTSLHIDMVRVCRAVIGLTAHTELNEREICEAARSLRNCDHDIGHVCCGDDVIQVLSVGLRKILGTNQAQDVRADRLRHSLRLAFEDVDFKHSAIGLSIRAWERRNLGYDILKV